MTARLIVCERTGRWVVALRRELDDADVNLVQTRTTAGCWAELSKAPASMAVVELTAAGAAELLGRMARLQREYTESGRARLFEQLEGCLIRGESTLSYAELARQLNLTEAAVKMSVQRLRARYRTILREEIEKTVSSPDQVEEEMRHLFVAFR